MTSWRIKLKVTEQDDNDYDEDNYVFSIVVIGTLPQVVEHLQKEQFHGMEVRSIKRLGTVEVLK